MKVIHVVESFAAGVLHFVVQLTHALPEYEHVVIHGERPDTPSHYVELFPLGVTLLPWKRVTRDISPISDILALYHLMRLLKQHKGDVIHLHSSKAGFLGRVAAKLLGLPTRVLYTPHGAAFLRQDVSPTKLSLFIWLEKLGNWCAGQVIACSASEAAAFQRYGIPADYINNGVECAKRPATPPTQTDTYCTIVVAGRISQQKNPALFNEIALAFLDQPHVRFVWIGDGELRHLLTAPNIHCTGWVEPPEVTAHLQQATIYLSTSLWEGLPLSALQAMCQGLPLVLSECTGHVDIVQVGRNGYLFKHTNEAIEILSELSKNNAFCFSLGTISQTLQKKNFNIQRMVESYKMLYI
ncbi:Glycosyltransferase involved in cell wall bisynthesis [Thiothrix caldifontis]|uniref:Glycosyltransferase involved in cell wall bisynthesis n=1 Tax=Thiothrix caldifontis TaxID=525918 RepID=A0A1H3VUR8_9GAMM|nr:glycosyltransferase [Thiothrix caldifontis]SDZ78516.1 Glycosyltransferase involved in cell wall bisynthesis [Thiothrix caldifontis]